MLQLHAPETLSGLEQLAQPGSLEVVDAERGQRRGVVGERIAVQIEHGLAVRHREDLDDAPAPVCLPLADLRVVEAVRNGLADEVAEEVLEIRDHRLVELHRGCARGAGLVDRELGRVGVAGLWGQIARHLLPPLLTDGELGDADVHRGERLARSVGQLHVRDRARPHEQRAPALAVPVAHLGRAGDLEPRGLGGERPRDLVERDEHHVGGPGHLAPLREDAALDLEAGRVAVAHHQEPAGIHHEIELAVGASEGAAELRMAQDVDGDAGSGFPSGLVTFPRSQPILSLSIVPSLTPSWMGRSPR